MKTIRISKTVFPKDRPENFNHWPAKLLFDSSLLATAVGVNVV